jgi:uncharacterized protein YbjT (DUF2867 family)
MPFSRPRSDGCSPATAMPDKDRQEALIERTALDWNIVPPAPFTVRAGSTPLQVVTDIPPGLQLRSITRAEVATFILDILESDQFIQ